MSYSDILLILLLCAWCAAAAIILIRRRKKGKHFICGGDCSSCPMKKQDCDIIIPKDRNTK
ncbi:MAG: FeoB-associated Cys-rich membrane protein [Clostridiales bacterium]|jgi:hypothetical protein|nr:FeoB-associated Cys-rich membrane protein [Clostridiales bacterium]